MLKVFNIAYRDFKGLFSTAIGWIVACVLLAISGIVFFIVAAGLLEQQQGSTSDLLTQILQVMQFFYIFIIPIFTMKNITDELDTGTYRIYATAPIKSWEIVLGKFFGIFTYFAVVFIISITYVIFMIIFAEPEYSLILSSLLGSLLHISIFISISLFIASINKNLITSYIVSALSIFIITFSTYIKGLPTWYTQNFNILELTKPFMEGEIKTSVIATAIAIIGSFLFLANNATKSRHWRF